MASGNDSAARREFHARRGHPGFDDERQRLGELAELRARLLSGALDWMPTIERSRERIAIRARIEELETRS